MKKVFNAGDLYAAIKRALKALDCHYSEMDEMEIEFDPDECEITFSIKGRKLTIPESDLVE